MRVVSFHAFVSAAVMAGVVSACADAGIVTFASDAAFIAHQNNGGFTKEFGGNVRWGNAGASGDWEYAIVNSNDMPIGAVAQTPWAGTNTHDVVFSYDGLGSTTLSLSGIGSITRSVTADPTVIFARVRDSVSPFSHLSLIEIDLAYNGVGVDYSFNLLTGDANAEYWGVEDANLRLGFTLSASATLDGPGSAGSDPMYQFKVGVPTPGTAALLTVAGLISIRQRR